MAAADFESIRNSVSAREAAEYYGLAVNRYGMALCPFHDDRHPSLKLDDRFHCFGCQADGSVIDFTAQLFNLTLRDAARKLADDFGIWVPTPNRSTIQRPQTPCAARKPVIRNETKELEELYHSILCDYYRRLRRWREQYAPKSPKEEYHPLFIEVLRETDYIEYLLDILDYGSDDERAALIQEQVHAISVLEKRFAFDTLPKGA